MKKQVLYIFFLVVLYLTATAQPRQLFEYELREGDSRPKPDLRPNIVGTQRAVSDGHGFSQSLTSPRPSPKALGEGEKMGSKASGWQPNGVVVCDTGGNAYPQIVSDGKSGAIICWQAGYQGGLADSTSDIYAQWVDSAGYCRWQWQGVPVCSLSNSYSSYSAMVSDGRGGAIIAWEDWGRGGDYYSHIYAQRVDSMGNLLWGDNGLLVCGQWSGYVDICSDGRAGAIITWVDGRNIGTNYEDIYAQRIDSAGNPVWAVDGVPVCEAESTQWRPHICSNNRSGAVITWEDDYRNNGTTGEDVYAQMIDSLGNAKWEINGKPICVKPQIQRARTPISNNFGGGIIGWWAFGDTLNDAYVQSFDSSGNKLWIDDVPLNTLDKFSSDNRGGGIGSYSNYSNRVDSLGNICWGAGVALHDTIPSGGQNDANEDGFGGLVAIWNYSTHLFAQRIDSSGVILWSSAGVPVCVNMNTNDDFKVIGDMSGGMIATWYGDSSNGAYKIYAQRIYSNGTPGGVAGYPVQKDQNVKLLMNVFPNPSKGRIEIEFSLTKPAMVELTVYNMLGQRVRTLVNSYKNAGRHKVSWDGSKAAAGVYFYRLAADEYSITKKMVLIK